MDIETYKKLNEELAHSVQQLKINNSCLEREVIEVTSKYFDERQKWLEERRETEQNYLRVIKNLKKGIVNSFNNAIFEIDCDEILTETQPSTRQHHLVVMRRSSMGVTMRSPLKSTSPEVVAKSAQQPLPKVITEEIANTENECDINAQAHNMWGLSNLRENTENNSENNSSCQSVDTTIHSPEKVATECRTKTIPSLCVTGDNGRTVNRRTTQVWQRSPTGIGKVSSAADSSNEELNSPDSDHLTVADCVNRRTMERLTMDFSENLVLHSTPRSSEIMELTPNKTECTIKNQTDDSNTNLTLRPRRQCAAVSYVEPPLNKKLRDESKKRQPKKKKRSK